MKRLHIPQPCLVALDGGRVTAVRWRERAWRVAAELGRWAYRGEWWRDPSLSGERREYFVLGTARGEIEVFRREGGADAEGWFVSGWWD